MTTRARTPTQGAVFYHFLHLLRLPAVFPLNKSDVRRHNRESKSRPAQRYSGLYRESIPGCGKRVFGPDLTSFNAGELVFRPGFVLPEESSSRARSKPVLPEESSSRACSDSWFPGLVTGRVVKVARDRATVSPGLFARVVISQLPRGCTRSRAY